MDITTVLIVIQSLLDDNPLHHEPGQENNNTKQNDLYNEIIKYESIKTLHLKNLKDTPYGFEVFKNCMLKEKEKYNDSIIKYLKENKNNPKKNIQVGFYRINIITDYKQLYEQYIKDKI